MAALASKQGQWASAHTANGFEEGWLQSQSFTQPTTRGDCGVCIGVWESVNVFESSSDWQTVILQLPLHNRIFSPFFFFFKFLFFCGLGDRPQCYCNLVSSGPDLLNWVANQEISLLNIFVWCRPCAPWDCGMSGKQKEFGGRKRGLLNGSGRRLDDIK